MADDISDPALETYLNVAYSFSQGLYRIWGAEAASARLMLALLEFHNSNKLGLDGPAARSLEHLARIPYSSYDSLAYVTNVSHLVYATTLLDTFLSDTTLFLFLLIPGSMGKNQQIPIRTLIDATSKNEALSRAAVSRSREISYLPFLGRVHFLRDSFGLHIHLDDDTVKALDHYPTIRNSAVHDQGIFELKLDDAGNVVSRQKACHLHPTQINGEDVHDAIKAYERAVRAIAESVFTQVLKQPGHPAVQDFLKRKSSVAERGPVETGTSDASNA